MPIIERHFDGEKLVRATLAVKIFKDGDEWAAMIGGLNVQEALVTGFGKSPEQALRRVVEYFEEEGFVKTIRHVHGGCIWKEDAEKLGVD